MPSASVFREAVIPIDAFSKRPGSRNRRVVHRRRLFHPCQGDWGCWDPTRGRRPLRDLAPVYYLAGFQPEEEAGSQLVRLRIGPPRSGTNTLGTPGKDVWNNEALTAGELHLETGYVG